MSKSKATDKKWFYMLLLAAALLIMVGAFWMGMGNDAIGFSVVSIYFLMPACIFAISFFMARTERGYRVLIWSLVFGTAFMLLEYLTFSLANMTAFGRFNFPDVFLLIAGTVIALISMVISKLTKKEEIKE